METPEDLMRKIAKVVDGWRMHYYTTASAITRIQKLLKEWVETAKTTPFEEEFEEEGFIW